MEALDLSMRQRDAAVRRCNCPSCPELVGPANGVQLRCGRIHHDQRGRFHMRLRPHDEIQSNRAVRRALARKSGAPASSVSNDYAGVPAEGQ